MRKSRGHVILDQMNLLGIFNLVTSCREDGTRGIEGGERTAKRKSERLPYARHNRPISLCSSGRNLNNSQTLQESRFWLKINTMFKIAKNK